MASNKFLVLNKCFHEGELYNPGDIVTLKNPKTATRHFKPYKTGDESELDNLREQCFEKGLVFEPAWGVDRLRELLGMEPPAHLVWKRGGRKVKNVKDALEK